jgi:hypothetical protein
MSNDCIRSSGHNLTAVINLSSLLSNIELNSLSKSVHKSIYREFHLRPLKSEADQKLTLINK